MLSHIKWNECDVSLKYKDYSDKPLCVLDAKGFHIGVDHHKNLPVEVCCVKKRPFRYVHGWFGDNYTFYYGGKYAQEVSVSHSKLTCINRKYQWTHINSPSKKFLDKEVHGISRETLQFYVDLFSFMEILHALEMVNFLTQNKVLIPDIKNHIYKMCIEFCVELEKKYITSK